MKVQTTESREERVRNPRFASEFATIPRQDTPDGRSRWKQPIAASAVVISAFGIGLWLGSPANPVSEHSATGSSAVASLFIAPPRDRAPSTEIASEKQALAAHTAKSRTLRLRATAHVSSEKARTGDSVLFLTEQPMETGYGQTVPAGALVEGVVSKATRSTSANPGSLVIEIRALHVGSKAIPLHALPYIPQVAGARPGATTGTSSSTVDIRSLGIRNALRVNSEAIMPRQSVIEFQLVERVPGEESLNSLEERLAPLKQSLPASAPVAEPAPTTVPTDSDPIAPTKKRKISIESA